MKDLKKVLVIHKVCAPGTQQKCFTSVVVGCEPEVGICLARPGKEKDPWFIYDGPLSPSFKYCLWDKETCLAINEFCLKQIKSGYLSMPAIYEFIDKLNAKPTHSGYAVCPYSL